MQQLLTHKKVFFYLFCMSVTSLSALSQNINNPYSVYGIGDIDDKVYNRTSGMAGTGIAIKSSGYLIDNNPAALTGLPRSFYIAHVSVTGRAYAFSGEPIDQNNSRSKDMWIKRFALAVKINKFWASSVGFGQFSNVNYQFTGNKFVEGTTNNYNTVMDGDGGLNDYYWTNAFSIGKHFSLGIKSSIIAGGINQNETLVDAALQSTITTKQQDYIGNLRFQGGALYETALNKRWDLSLGARFSPRTRFSAERDLTITENGTNIFTNSSIKSDRFYLPNSFAGGIALKHDKKTTFAADYSYEDWSSLHVKETSWQLISSSKVSAGMEFAKFKNMGAQAVEYKFFQLGGYYNNSYLQVRNTPIHEYGITGGVGGLFGRGLLYSLSLEAGVKGTTKAKLIKETYVGLTLNLSYSDFLYSKGKKYN